MSSYRENREGFHVFIRRYSYTYVILRVSPHFSVSFGVSLVGNFIPTTLSLFLFNISPYEAFLIFSDYSPSTLPNPNHYPSFLFRLSSSTLSVRILSFSLFTSTLSLVLSLLGSRSVSFGLCHFVEEGTR